MTNKAKKPTGWIIWRGKSPYDGENIVCLAVESRNKKTGLSLQTWILRDDIDPLTASKTGNDQSVCGSCPLRGLPSNDPNRKTAEKRGCYVTLAHAPLSVYKSYKAGKYPEIHGHEALAELGSRYKLVRLGGYGDPAMVDHWINESLISRTNHTAYSHQSGHDKSFFNPDIYMTSADSLEQAQGAWNIGQRTFRLVKSLSEIIKGREILCPASKEAGEKVTCLDCKLCGGASVKAKSIAIVAHGAGASYV